MVAETEQSSALPFSKVYKPVQINGLWVPKIEAKRFLRRQVADGLIDLDVAKVLEAIEVCSSRRRAIDVGAHIGAVSVALASRFALVEAFEPIKTTYDCLVRNTAAFPNVRTHRAAAADERKKLYFEVVPRHSQISHAVKPGEATHYDHREGKIIGPIRALPIDDFGFEDLDFVKIDVEGSELDVVQGMRETILRCKPVIMLEQAKNDVRYHGGIPHAASKLLEQLGMQRLSSFNYKHDRVYFPA